MHFSFLNVLLTLTAQVHTKEVVANSMDADIVQGTIDKLADHIANKMFSQALKAMVFRPVDFENVTLGKLGQLASRTANRFPHPIFDCPAVSSNNLHRHFPFRGRFAQTNRPLVIASSIRSDLLASIGSEPKDMADEEALLAKSTFPIPPEQLIGLAKAFGAAQEAGTAAGEGGPDWFAPDFRFVAPVVGPFDKETFIDSLKSFELKSAFSNLKGNAHHYRVCPFEPNRVWYSVKFMGTNDGPVLGGPPTNRNVESPVTAHSITFNEKGEVTKFTIGYVLDKETGNTGGLGGVFGLFYAIGRGLPFPEAQPWQPSPLYGAGMSANRAIQDVFKANPQLKKAFFRTVSTIGGKGD